MKDMVGIVLRGLCGLPSVQWICFDQGKNGIRLETEGIGNRVLGRRLKMDKLI
jgi:hypothetical protein